MGDDPHLPLGAGKAKKALRLVLQMLDEIDEMVDLRPAARAIVPTIDRLIGAFGDRRRLLAPVGRAYGPGCAKDAHLKMIGATSAPAARPEPRWAPLHARWAGRCRTPSSATSRGRAVRPMRLGRARPGRQWLQLRRGVQNTDCGLLVIPG